MEPLYKNRDWLYEQYITQDKIQSQIAKKAKCSRSHIRRQLFKFNIKKPKKLYHNKKWLYTRYIVENITLEKIAQECGVSRTIIGKYAKKFTLTKPVTSKTITCQICKNTFSVFPSQPKKYCSQKCKGIGWSKAFTGKNHPKYNKKAIPCAHCDKIVYVIPYREQNSNRIFCSQRCHYSYNTKENAHNWKSIPTICEICGINFFVAPHRLKYLKQNHTCLCSPKCQGKWQTKYRIGAKSSCWKGGKSFEPYPPTFNKQFKHLIRERDNYTCICGEEGNSVHHINYVKENTTPENCITLCKVCHGKTNGNREHWEEVLTKIMEERNE